MEISGCGARTGGFGCAVGTDVSGCAAGTGGFGCAVGADVFGCAVGTSVFGCAVGTGTIGCGAGTGAFLFGWSSTTTKTPGASNFQPSPIGTTTAGSEIVTSPDAGAAQ